MEYVQISKVSDSDVLSDEIEYWGLVLNSALALWVRDDC
jgi:hypothetical protein